MCLSTLNGRMGEKLVHFLNMIRPYAELSAFISTSILAIGLIFSWSQVKSFKNDIKIRNKRQSKEKSIEASEIYMSKFIDAHKIFFNDRIKSGFHSYKGEAGDFSESSLSKEQQKNGLDLMSIESIVPVLNMLEIISAYFVSGVADEKTGFQIIGRSYCGTVNDLYAVICLLRGKGSVQPYWYNIVELHNVWHSRFQREGLKEENEDLQERLRSLPERSISAVGCED